MEKPTLKEGQNYLEPALDFLDIGILLLDSKFNIIHVNSKMSRFLEISGNLFGKSVFDIEIWPFTDREIVESSKIYLLKMNQRFIPLKIVQVKHTILQLII